MKNADRVPGNELTTEQIASAGRQAAQEGDLRQPPQRQDTGAPGEPAPPPPGGADIVQGEVVDEGDSLAARPDGVADVTGTGPAGETVTSARPDDRGVTGAGPAGDGLDDQDAFDDDLLDEDVFDDQVLIEDEEAADADTGGLAAGADPGVPEPGVPEPGVPGPGVPEPGVPEPGAAGGTGDGSLGGEPQPHTHLLEGEELRTMVMRWKEIQAQFVDEPEVAVADADALVAELMQRLARLFADERARLESRWAGGGDVSTEDLRQGLRHYRSFFERLLAA